MVSLLYELIYVLTFASGLLSVLAKPVGFEKAGILLFISQLLLSALFVVFKNSKTTGRYVSIGILSGFAIFVLFLSRYDAFMGKAIENVRLLWLLAFALAAFVLGEMCAYLRVFGIIVSGLSFASLIPLTILKVNIPKFYVAAVFFLFVIMLMSEIERRWKKAGDTELKAHIVYNSLFVMLIIALVLILPYSPKPYKWTWVRNIYSMVRETVTEIQIRTSIRKDEDYAEGLIGFSDRGGFAGELKSKEETVLSVAGIPKDTVELRLAGKNFSTFTGREWIEDDRDTAPDAMFDTIGLIASLEDYTDSSSDYVRWEKMRIEYIQMNTNYIFVPEKSAIRKSNLPVYSFDVLYKGGDIIWPKTQSYKTAYNLVYLLANTENEDFINFIKEGDTPSEKAYFKTLKKHFNLELDEEYSYKKFLDHQEYIHNLYAQDVILSDELRAYTEKLYEGCENDYDKCVRIEELLKTFEYTETPGTVPDYVHNETEFLDYFILESRKGYCSYFATAFALLARAEGIPARYVQGYDVKTGSKSAMYITSSMAHAWTEVYFDGAGWIAFDGTPGYGNGTYWAGSSKHTDLPPITTYERKETPAEVSELPELPEEEPEKGITVKWYMIAIPIVSGIAVIALFFAVFKLTSAFRFRKLAADKKFEILCRQVFGILNLLGVKREEYETIAEFKTRLEKDYGDKNLEFLGFLERYLYDVRDESTDYAPALDKTMGTKDEFLKELKKKRPVRYVLYQLRY